MSPSSLSTESKFEHRKYLVIQRGISGNNQERLLAHDVCFHPRITSGFSSRLQQNPTNPLCNLEWITAGEALSCKE